MRTLCTYVFLMCCSILFSQRIQNMSVSLVNSQNQGVQSQVLVRFSLSPGQGCPGYEILHCTDSINFLQVYNYVGICGNQNTTESFNFTHGSPGVEMINYYKVSIPGFEVSPIHRIYVTQQSPKPNLMVYPNPVFSQDFINLRYFNYVGTKLEGFIFNQFGKSIQTLYMDITQNESVVNISELTDGLYIVWLTDGNWLFRSKFIVKRIQK